MRDPNHMQLICPGLLGPLPALPQSFPAMPVCDRLLARGRRIATVETDPLALLCASCGLASGELDRDLPTASLCLLGEDPAAA